jgi:hypothetical protein
MFWGGIGTQQGISGQIVTNSHDINAAYGPISARLDSAGYPGLLPLAGLPGRLGERVPGRRRCRERSGWLV